MGSRYRLSRKSLFIGCIPVLAWLIIIGAAARAADEPPPPLPLKAIGVDMSTSNNHQGLIQFYNLEMFGPQSCTRFGDPYTPLILDAPGSGENTWYDELNGAYTYRIAIPPDYTYDQVRVELFDPQTGNLSSRPTTICQSDDDTCTTTIPVCNPQTEPCLLSTTIGGTNTDPANPYYFARMDEVRHDCSEALGNASYTLWRPYNTRTLFRLYYYKTAAGGGVEPVDLAYYIGKKDDPEQTALADPFGEWQAAQSASDAQSEALATMLSWVSPGAPASERMPAFTEGAVVNGVRTQRGSPAEPATVTEDCDAIRPVQMPFGVAGVTVGSSEACAGNGDFIVSLGSETPSIFTDSGSGTRYLYLDVRGIDGESENNFSIWAGPTIGEDPDAAAPAEANARQLYVLRQGTAGHTLHDSRGLNVYGVGHLPLNLDACCTHGRFPIAELGPAYAGLTITVSVFDADFPKIPDPPLIFYMDTISQNDWEACFSRDGAGDCVTDQGGGSQFYLGTETLGLATNNAWGTYTFTLPAGLTGGRLMVYYSGTLLDTSGWKVTVSPPGAPTLVSPDEGASLVDTPLYRWQAPIGGAGYQFEYDDDPGFTSPLTYLSGEIGGLSFTPPDQAVGDYYWRVRARNPVYDWGEWSEARAVHIIPPPPPNAPENLHTTRITQTEVDLAWTDKSDDEAGFIVSWSPAGGNDWHALPITAPDVTTTTGIALACGTDYDFQVVASNANGVSEPATTRASTDACTVNVTLTVTGSGDGGGTMTDGAGIDCAWDGFAASGACSATAASGTATSITAAAVPGSTFLGWTGCDSVSGAVCSVAPAADRTVTASFAPVCLLQNCSFEKPAGANHLPDAWKRAGLKLPGDGTDSSTFAAGLQSMRFANPRAKAKKLAQDLKLNGPAGKLNLSFWWRAQDVIGKKGQFRVSVYLYYKRGGVGRFTINMPIGTADWTKYTLPITAKKDYKKIRVTIAFGKMGAAWFDGFSLYTN